MAQPRLAERPPPPVDSAAATSAPVLDAERALLGGVLLHGSVEGLNLAPAQFRSQAHGAIYSAALAVLAQGPLDRITLKDELARLGMLDSCGGEDYLDLLDKTLPASANLQWYARIIAADARRRDLLRAARALARELDNPKSDTDEVLRAFSDATKEIAQPRETGRLVDSALRLSVESLRRDPPAREYMLRDANTGNGVYVQGKVGLLAAAGGSGKTWALNQLSVSVATGTTWFGPGGWAPVRPGRVLMVLGEEDADEVERRLHFSWKAGGLVSDEQLGELARNVTPFGLAGRNVSLTRRDGEETLFAKQLRQTLVDAVAEERPYTLVILDPLARFAAGTDVEKDNDSATLWVETVERLTWPDCGRPSVLVAHHTKKKGENDDADSADLIRGASALVAGVRWAARLEQQKRQVDAPDLLTLRLVKANGVPPLLGPVVLCRDMEHEGALRLATTAEMEAHEGVAKITKARVQAIEDHRGRVLDAMQPGEVYSRNRLATMCGKRAAVLAAITELIAAGKLEAVGNGRRDPRAGVRLVTPPTPATGDLFTLPGTSGTSAGTSSEKAAELTGSPAPHTPRRGVGSGTSSGRGPETTPSGSEGTSSREPADREPAQAQRDSGDQALTGKNPDPGGAA